jgi:hypothetical protein
MRNLVLKSVCIFICLTIRILNIKEVKFNFSIFSFQPSFELVKKLEEIRLSESRRSPRLADQERDTDFARLADMAGDRRRSSSYCIDVPLMQFTQNG